MTYTHYGEIGDVWKHLPLAEILSLNPPAIYWESHAASGMYELTPTPEQQYGAITYLEQADSSDVLKNSPYTEMLDTYLDDRGNLRQYPGSPLIALRVLNRLGTLGPDERSFVFCDIEADAIKSLQHHVADLGYRGSQVTTIHDDGISTLMEALSATNPAELSNTFVHLDPYWPGDTGANGQTAWDLFTRSIQEGARAMLWYGYQTKGEESAKNSYFEEKIAWTEDDPEDFDLWTGEIIVNAFHQREATVHHPGVFGCGVVCGNLREETTNRCRAVGQALVACYGDAELPDGSDGSLDFVEPQF